MPCTIHTGSCLSLRNAWQPSRSHHFLTAKCWQGLTVVIKAFYLSCFTLLFSKKRGWLSIPLGVCKEPGELTHLRCWSPSQSDQRSILQVTPGSNSEVVSCSSCWLQKQYSTMFSQTCERGFGDSWCPPPLMGATSFAQSWCSTVEQQCEAGWCLGLNHSSPVLRGGISPVLFPNVLEMHLVFLQYMKSVFFHLFWSIKRTLKEYCWKYPILAKMKGKMGEWERTVCGLGVGHWTQEYHLKPQYNLKSFPEISFPGGNFPSCLVPVAEFSRAS